MAGPRRAPSASPRWWRRSPRERRADKCPRAAMPLRSRARKERPCPSSNDFRRALVRCAPRFENVSRYTSVSTTTLSSLAAARASFSPGCRGRFGSGFGGARGLLGCRLHRQGLGHGRARRWQVGRRRGREEPWPEREEKEGHGEEQQQTFFHLTLLFRPDRAHGTGSNPPG